MMLLLIGTVLVTLSVISLMDRFSHLVNTADFTVTAITFQTVCLGPMISISFATSMAMFWHRALFLRVAMALAMITPAFAVFTIVGGIVLDWIPMRELKMFATIFLSQFLFSAVAALAVQFFSRWTLTSKRAANAPPLGPIGLSAFFELTVFFAIGFAAMVALDEDDVVYGIAFFGAWGLLSTPAVIGVLIASLRGSRRFTMGWIAAFVFCFLCATMINGYIAIEMFSWNGLQQNVGVVLLVSIYGTAMMLAVLYLSIRVLKHFNWQCVNRRQFKPM
ncbi:hypothetical protein [Rubripirellula amarantea]|nr:hypothetical protein [Rubripirellula amarantea]